MNQNIPGKTRFQRFLDGDEIGGDGWKPLWRVILPPLGLVAIVVIWGLVVGF